MSAANAPARVAALRRFKPYPAYKHSGVTWLGDIPAGWEAKRLKFVAPIRAAKLDEKPEDALYVGLEHVESWTGRLLIDRQPEVVESAVATFKAGDVLFGKLRPYLAKAASPDVDGVCTTEILALRPNAGASQRFVMYSLLNAPYIRWLDSLTFGTKMPRLSPDQVSISFVSVPSAPEQRAIVTFLDRETSRIDELMAKKERLIELLQEQRTALITRAVTKGLDPSVPMKDSGVEWLGEIPAHWEVKPLKRFLARCDYGISENLTSGGDIRVLTMGHIQNGEVILPDQGSVNHVDGDLFLRHNDLVFNRTNSRELVAKVALFRGSFDDRVTFASYLVRLAVQDGVDAKWLNYLLNSTGVLGLARSMALLSVNQANLNPTKYTQIALPCPAETEQRVIASSLDHDTTKLDALISKVQAAIVRLSELRTAVVSAAVTGKIDVRAKAA